MENITDNLMNKIHLAFLLSIGVALSSHASDNRAPASIDIDAKEKCVCVQGEGCPCEGYGDNKKDGTKPKNTRQRRGRGVGIFRDDSIGINIPQEVPKNM